MTMDPNAIVDFGNLAKIVIAKLCQVDEISQVKSHLADYARTLRIEYFLFVAGRSSSLATPDIILIDNLPTGWREYYRRNEVIRNDPITTYCLSNTTPVLWGRLAQRPEYAAPAYAKVIQSAARYGLVSGLTIPLRAPSGEFSMLSLISSQPAEQIEPRLESLMPFAQFVAGHLLEAVIRNRWLSRDKDGEPALVRLTNREHECLFWACEGKTSWEIAKILGISERTTLFHLNNVTTKLGASNRQHAVAKGLLLNLVRPRFVQQEQKL